MGCSPSVLLEHIHRDSSANQDKRTIKKNAAPPHANIKKEANRSVVHGKNLLPLTPDDDLLDVHVLEELLRRNMVKCPYCGGDNYPAQNTNNNDFGSTDPRKNLYIKDGGAGAAGGWWCFSWCRAKADGPQYGNEVARNYESPPGGAVYKRRPTISIQLDSNSVDGGNNVRRNTYLINPPILKHKKVVHDVRYGTILPPSRSPLLLLAVFNQLDSTCETLMRAGEKLGFDVTFSDSYDSALEEFQNKSHDLIIVDARSSKLDYDTLCRSIRNTKGTQHVVMVAVVKKSAFEKEDLVVSSLLDSGYNRCIVENSNVVVWVNELTQLRYSDVRPLAQYSTTQVLFAAIDKSRDSIVITDDNCRVQYINSTAELTLGYRHEEVLGKSLQDQLAYDPIQINTMSSRLQKGRTWQGVLMFRRKSQETMTAACGAVPVSCAGRTPTHFALILDHSAHDGSRGSIHSIRKGSIDVRSIGSDYARRTSLAKLSALPLEAPITKIINLIAQAQDSAGSNAQIVNSLDKVVEILRSTELYSPQMKDDLRFHAEEPITTDLITALLSGNQQFINYSSRRSSNDSTTVRAIRGSTRAKVGEHSEFKIDTEPEIPTDSAEIHHFKNTFQTPSQIRELLDKALSWEFDMIRLEELTGKRPLAYMGLHLMNHFEVCSTLNCDERTMHNFLILIESKYHAGNCYHNSTHAADVMQAVAAYLDREKVKQLMDRFDVATALIAAGCHDVDHPGRSNAFLANSGNSLAILYNDLTVLENHHASLTFKLALGDDRVNIFKNLDREDYKVVRQNIVDMILATEMTKHFEYFTKFVQVCSPKDEDPANDCGFISSSENLALIKRMMIKCADVSNPTRPLPLCVEWTRRITEEYFQQTDEEKSKGLPVVMPMFDRATCSVPKAQIGFINFIINDMIDEWHRFIDFPEIVVYMKQNYLKWKEFDEQGFSTLADIKKLQATVIGPSKSTPTVAE